MRDRLGWMGVLVAVLLAGCVTAPGGAAKAGSAAAAATPSLRSQAAQLPGVELAAGEPLVLRYPGLFAEGAALPLAGGVEQLQPLGDFLQQAGATRWQLRVRGDGPQGLALAEARARLLRGFFERRGLAGERLQWQAAAGAGPALELQLGTAP